jgi:DNA-binding NarL/FixJ family response regulator
VPTQSSSPDPDYHALRVLIVDDVPQVRQELRGLLQLTSELEVVGEAANGLEAISQAKALRPDVVVMDLEMPVMDGFEATRLIKSCGPAPRVVILSVHASPEEQQCAQEAGADGFVVKGASYQILLNAILAKDGSPHSFNLEKGEKP